MVKSKNFRQYLIKVIGLTVFIPLLVLALVSHVNINRLIDSIEAEQKNTAQFVSAGIDKQVRSAESLLAYASGLLAERPTMSPEEMTTSMRLMRERFPEFLNLHIDNREGECIAFVSDDPANDRRQIGSSHQKRWHYLKQQQQVGQHISDVFQGKGGTNEWIVSLTAAVLGPNGQPSAYVNGALNLHEIAARSLREEARHFKIAVTDRQQRVVWTNVPEISIGSDFFSNREMAVAFGASTASPTTGWYVYVDSKSDTVKKNDSIILAILIFLLTGVLSVVAGQLAAKPLAGTVEALSAEAQDGVQGKPIRFLPVELERLRGAWLSAVGARDRARAELEAVNRDLELLVEERTSSLEGQKVLMESLISSLNDLVILYDDRYVVVLANQRAADSLDVRVGKNWLETLSRHFDNPESASVGEEKRRFKSRDGRVFDFIPLKVVPNDRGGRAVNGMVLRDVTEKAALDDLRSSLVSVVAHEMKTPLASLQLQIPLLTDAVDEKTPAFTELLQEIEDSTESLSRLINDWLDWSRLENNTLYVVPRLIRVDKVLKKAGKMVCRHHDLAIETEASCLGVTAYADPIRLEQVFINLMTNAVRYRSADTPRIRVDIRRAGNAVEILIADNGIGIPLSEREKVFDCFYQIDMSSTRRQGGTGMGLAISRGIMRALGGDIRVTENEGETSGTTFLLQLPGTAPQETETESE